MEIHKVSKSSEGILRKTINLTNIISAVILGIMMLLVTIEATLRYLFGGTLLVAVDITEFSMTVLTFLPAAYILTNGRHVNMDLFIPYIRRLGRVKRIILQLFCLIIALVPFAVVAWKGWGFAWDAYRADARTNSAVPMPTVFNEIWLPIGISIMVILLISEVLYNIGLLVKKGKSEEGDQSGT